MEMPKDERLRCAVPIWPSEPARWTAIVLAGRRPGADPLSQHFGQPDKALIPVADDAMLNWVVSALLDTASIERVLILTQFPDELRRSTGFTIRRPDRVTVLGSRGGIAESIIFALETVDVAFPVLVTTADHPLLTPHILSDFVARASHRDLAVGVVERRTVMRRYPEAKRTWLKFWDGAYTGANLFAFGSANARVGLDCWVKAEQDRKQALKLFWHFGPRLALRAFTRTISFAKALKRAGDAIGIDAGLVVLDHPDAAIDVDKVSDHRLVERILRSRTVAARRRMTAA